MALPREHPLSRRLLLGTGAGLLTTAAAAWLLRREGERGGPGAQPASAPARKTAALQPPQPAPFAPTAKRVIFLFMSGGPSQFDLFEHKPALAKLNGQPIPASLIPEPGKTTLEPASYFWQSPYRFARSGQTGTPVSDLLPHTRRIVDELCFVRSMQTDTLNHHPGEHLLFTGVPRFGHPSMGSWVTYGLGSECDNLPAFVVLNPGEGTFAGSNIWSSGFLPSNHQGVLLRTSGEPIPYLANPGKINPDMQGDAVAAVNDLNALRHARHGDPEALSRIAAYEMAFRMQSAAPSLVDLRSETQEARENYGVDRDPTRAFGTACLLARRLAERGVRFIQINWGSWDAHIGLDENHRRLARGMDQPSAALIQDLRARGMLDDTLVIWGAEFGRTPTAEHRRRDLEHNRGRDHHADGFLLWMAGGGVKRGHSHGQTDELGLHVAQDPVHVHDLQATILHCLGIDHTALTYPHQGRDHRLTDVGGNVVRALLA